MILVDIRVIVAWLDSAHPAHAMSTRALEACGQVEELGVTSLTLAELAAGGCRENELLEDLKGFVVLPLDSKAALLAGRKCAGKPGHGSKWHLSDCLLWSQANQLKVPILTLPGRGIAAFAGASVLVPDAQPAIGRKSRRTKLRP